MEVRVLEETRLLERITVNPKIFGGKPVVRGRRLAVEHVLGMLPLVILPKRFWKAIRGWSLTTFRHV